MNLIALGKVAVASPGTPVRATANQADPTRIFNVNSFVIQALPTNTGNIYVGTSSAMNKSTFVGVAGVIPPSTFTNIPAYGGVLVNAPGGIELQSIWLDADNASEGALVTGVLG